MGSKPSGISGSRAAAILGLSNWSTPVDAWLKIMEELESGFCVANGFIKPERKDSAIFRWGLAFEDAIIDVAESLSGVSIRSREKLFHYKEYEHINCHVDGIYKNNIIHEGKTTNNKTFREKWGEPGTDRLPQEYQIQVQHQMICTGLKQVIISVLVFPRMVDEWEADGYSISKNSIYSIRRDDKPCATPYEWSHSLKSMGYFHQYVVHRNEQLQRLMLEFYFDFWNNHVVKKTPPNPYTYDDIKRLVVAPKGTIIADDDICRHSQEYKQITTEVGILNKRKDQLKTIILNSMRGKADVPIDDDSVEKWILRDTEGRKLHSYDGKTFR